MSQTRPRLETFTLGAWTVHAIQAGGLRLDGGAMFGVVPKTLWERRIRPDERNRVPMGMRCLLVEHDVGLVLIDTGAGNKEDPKFLDIYGIDNVGSDGRTALEDGIRAAGHRPEDVGIVINSHLHFDHGGGNTYRDADGSVKPSFPNARYVVQAGEYHFATHTNERTAPSYFARNFVPLYEQGRLDVVEGEKEIVPGVRVLPTPGHVPFHQSVLLGSRGECAFYLGDLVPTSAHLPLPWIMGYDLEPLVTLEMKRRFLRRAMDEGWLVVFEHDATHAWGHVTYDGRAYALDPKDSPQPLDRRELSERAPAGADDPRPHSR
jgi:glyoxylase-like metal-dependent hydrolase (beta-lactamase superfamily II)